MFSRIGFIPGWLRRLGASRSDLRIANLALRQQLAILKTERPRPRMGTADRFFWLTLRRLWPRWKEVLAAMDFFTVPTANFRVLYVVFVVHHARRTVLLARVTE